MRELFVASLIRLYARLRKRGFDIIPALLPELILDGQILTKKYILTYRKGTANYAVEKPGFCEPKTNAFKLFLVVKNPVSFNKSGF